MAIEIPDFLSHLPVWNGLPVPWTTMLIDGEPDFRSIDILRVLDCAKKRMCGICGKEIPKGDWIAFIGGPLCVKHRQFVDPPMHKDCAYFSAKACPFLAGTKREYATGESKTEKSKPDLILKIEQKRPDTMFIYLCKTFEYIATEQGIMFMPAERPRKLDWKTMPRSRP
jgi:hypothetical protein